jgi:hypothetical protein
MDPTLILAALTGLDRAHQQFHHPTPTRHGHQHPPAIQRPHRRHRPQQDPNGNGT